MQQFKQGNTENVTVYHRQLVYRPGRGILLDNPVQFGKAIPYSKYQLLGEGQKPGRQGVLVR
jgi:hypothetical protein